MHRNQCMITNIQSTLTIDNGIWTDVDMSPNENVSTPRVEIHPLF